MAARFIGWADSPFQLEVGFASLGFAAVGLLAFRAASISGSPQWSGRRCSFSGAAAGHLHQMITAGNFAPGNAGVIFYTDVLIPLIGFALLWLQRRCEPQSAAPAHVRP